MKFWLWWVLASTCSARNSPGGSALVNLLFSSDQIQCCSFNSRGRHIQGKHRHVTYCFQALSSFACSPLNSFPSITGGESDGSCCQMEQLWGFCGTRGDLSWWETDVAPFQGFPAHQEKGAGGAGPNLLFCLSVACFPEPSLGCSTQELGLIYFSPGSPEAIWAGIPAMILLSLPSAVPKAPADFASRGTNRVGFAWNYVLWYLCFSAVTICMVLFSVPTVKQYWCGYVSWTAFPVGFRITLLQEKNLDSRPFEMSECSVWALSWKENSRTLHREFWRREEY